MGDGDVTKAYWGGVNILDGGGGGGGGTFTIIVICRDVVVYLVFQN